LGQVKKQRTVGTGQVVVPTTEFGMNLGHLKFLLCHWEKPSWDKCDIKILGHFSLKNEPLGQFKGNG